MDTFFEIKYHLSFTSVDENLMLYFDALMQFRLVSECYIISALKVLQFPTDLNLSTPYVDKHLFVSKKL